MLREDRESDGGLQAARTRKALLQALIELIAEVGFEGVTVAGVAERALVNRSTFYRYYEDKTDLLLRGSEALFDELALLVKDRKPELQRASADLSAAVEPPVALIASLDHIARNRAFYEALLGPGGVPVFRERVEEYHRELIGRRIASALRRGKAPVGPDTVDIRMLTAAAAGAFMGLIREWVAGGCRTQSGMVASQFLGFVANGILGGEDAARRSPRPPAS